MKWRPFHHGRDQYDLSHLHPFALELENPAKGDRPAQPFRFDVRFSLHCFTRSIAAGDDPKLEYKDNRETRTFCFDRYRLSFQLPGIVRHIHEKRCLHTGKGNFFIVEVTDDAGHCVEYEIYFDISKGKGTSGAMELFIQSAYVRDVAGRAYRRSPKKIGFFVIAHNRRVGKPIKTPR